MNANSDPPEETLEQSHVSGELVEVTSDIIKSAKKVGRAYFSSCLCQGIEIKVGDFIKWISNKYLWQFRVAALYRAKKSYVGQWDHNTMEIQKQGEF